MRRRPGLSLRVGVSRSAVSLLRASRWGGAALTLVAEQSVVMPFDDSDAAALWHAIGVAIHQLLAQGTYAGWPVSFVVADDLARLWQVTPPPGVGSLADLEAAAALRFQSLYGDALYGDALYGDALYGGAPHGDTANGWCVMADWDSRAAFFAAALPLPLLAALRQVAAANQLAIVETVPQFIDAWNRWSGALKASAWYGLVHDNILTIAAIQARRLCAVRVLPLPLQIQLPNASAQPDAGAYAWLAQAIEREALLLDLAPPTDLQLCGQVPAGWSALSTAELKISVLDLSQRAAFLASTAAGSSATGTPAAGSPAAGSPAASVSSAAALALCGSRG